MNAKGPEYVRCSSSITAARWRKRLNRRIREKAYFPVSWPHGPGAMNGAGALRDRNRVRQVRGNARVWMFASSPEDRALYDRLSDHADRAEADFVEKYGCQVRH